MNMDLIKTFYFEAAHKTLRPDGMRLHGHSYRVDVVVAGPINEALGWVMDYADIGAAFQPIFAILDHRYLNEVEGMQDPTLEGVEAWIKKHLESSLTTIKELHVSIVGKCHYEPENLKTDRVLGLPTRLRMGFEAAHFLPNLAEEHKCRRMHGHSFTAEIGALDLKAVEPALQALYPVLNECLLNDIEGLENPTSEMLARWIWQRLGPKVPGLNTIVVAETCTARCVYRGASSLRSVE